MEGGPDGAAGGDAPADARPIERFIHAGAETQLSVVDIETKTAMMLGRFIDVATTADLSAASSSRLSAVRP